MTEGDKRRKIEQYCGRPETAINILAVFESGNVNETPSQWGWKRKKDTNIRRSETMLKMTIIVMIMTMIYLTQGC